MRQLSPNTLYGLRGGLRAIAYFRVADDDKGSREEIEGAFLEYCDLNLHQPIKTFASTWQDDAEYGRMVRYMQESGSEFLVVVPGARHLGPDLESVARSLVQLDGIGAKITCFDDDFPDPLQNAFQTLGIKGVSRTRSQSIKESMRARALQGQVLGRTLYGYRSGPDRTLEVERDEAAVVELIYRLYTRDGLGLRLIAQHLNERDIPTRRGGRWNVVSIRDILRNPAYTGTYSRFGMRRPKVHEAIIPPDVFRAAQDQTRARRPLGRVVNPEPFLLSGVLYCAYCGNKMMGVTRRQSWKRKDGHRARQVYRYYQCQSRNNQSICGYHTWRASLLEGTVLTQLRYALQAKASQVSTDGGAVAAKETEVQAMRDAKVTNAERRFLQAMKRSSRGNVSIKVLGEYLKELDAARRGAAGVGRPEDIESTLANWESLDLEARRTFLAEHVGRITVEDERVEVVV